MTSKLPRPSFGVAFQYLVLIMMTAIVLVPPIVVFFGAFKTKQEFLSSSRLAPPASFANFDNFVRFIDRADLWTSVTNTGIVLGLSLLGNVVLGTMVAYALGRFDFVGRRLIMALYLVAMAVPMVTTQVATFGVMSNLGLINTYFAPVLLYLGTDVLAIYIYLQFIRGIPVALDESARLEGAGLFRIYWSIILPLLRPAIATVVIINAIKIYNDFYIPFLYMPSQKLNVISTTLYKFVGPFGAEWQVICAGIILVLIPTLILFVLLQRLVYAGFTQGAVK